MNTAHDTADSTQAPIRETLESEKRDGGDHLDSGTPFSFGELLVDKLRIRKAIRKIRSLIPVLREYDEIRDEMRVTSHELDRLYAELLDVLKRQSAFHSPGYSSQPSASEIVEQHRESCAAEVTV